MLKFCCIALFFCLVCDLAVGVETNATEKDYYKQIVSTAAAETYSPVAKDEIKIAMEGQPPSSKSVTSNTAKINSINSMVRKGSKSKTVPRKGVILDKDKLNDKTDQNDNVNLNVPSKNPIVEEVNKLVVTPKYSKEISINSSTALNSTEKSTTVLHVAPVREIGQQEEVANNTVITNPARKPKPKPLVTIGGKEADEPIPASPTNKSPLGMPRKIDYIVPVVITITALPLLGVAFYVLFKRGRDYWDKRHYRRMDFLIDGMYNE